MNEQIRPTTGLHAVSKDEALRFLEAEGTGLSGAEAARRLSELGPNRLPAPPKRSAILRFLAHFHNVLIYVLIASAVVTAVLQHWVDTVVILAVVLANAVIGFVQEGRAEQAMDAIRGMLAPHSSVLRDGRRQSVGAADLVPGDIVLVEAGDRVPADLRLLEARSLKVEEAVLTGESVPVDKGTAPVAQEVALGDRTSMLFSGTLVAAGAGRGRGCRHRGRHPDRSDQRDAVGRADLDDAACPPDGCLRPLAHTVYPHGCGQPPRLRLLRRPPSLRRAFYGSGRPIRRRIPEGLPAVLTITLAVGVQAMARRNAIVRRLPAIETLGSVSVICSDKTGTLTRNEMMVSTLASSRHIYSVGGTGYAPEGAVRWREADANPAEHAVLTEFARAAGLCNDAVLHGATDGWRVEGDPMEGALMALAGKITGAGPRPFQDWSRTDAIPFDAAHRYMAVLHDDHRRPCLHPRQGRAGGFACALLGPARRRARHRPARQGLLHGMVEELAAEGLRVIAVAVRAVEQGRTILSTSDLADQLTLIGLIGLIDPPRAEAIEAVAECHTAGIRVKMITGDHAATARAIAGQIGLKNHERVLTGADVEALSDAALADAAVETDVFARTSPAHKLRLVTALQSRGLTVAMTGDGVNDAPALKRADAGIAMGQKGSEAAKESAELVLADDNFASIAAAVREGRTVYDNIKKSSAGPCPPTRARR